MLVFQTDAWPFEQLPTYKCALHTFLTCLQSCCPTLNFIIMWVKVKPHSKSLFYSQSLLSSGSKGTTVWYYYYWITTFHSSAVTSIFIITAQVFYFFIIYLLTLCLKLDTGNRNSLGQLLRNHYMINRSMINIWRPCAAGNVAETFVLI
jgi:hypothetical protein